MRIYPAKYRFISLATGLLVYLHAASVGAVVPSMQHTLVTAQGSVHPDAVLLAENETGPEHGVPQESGTLVLPAATEQTPDKEKKCMTVCGRWGDECMFINRGAGGLTKKCRRACKKFVEECF